MASNKNLPLDISTDVEFKGEVTYSNEVIATIAGIAANEIEGIAEMIPVGGWNEYSRKSRNITKGIKIELGSEEVSLDIYVSIEYGTPIQKAAFDVQNNIKKSIEAMTGLHVLKVDVHVQGVSFEKETEETKNLVEKTEVLIDEPKEENETKEEKKS